MRFKVHTFLVFAFSIASMAPLLVFWLWPYSGILDNKVADVRERHLLIANNLGAALETYHRDIVVAMDSFAPEIAEGRGQDAEPIFIAQNFRHICVVDYVSGRVFHSYLAQDFKCPAVVPKERLLLFQELADGGRTAMSAVFAEEGDRPRIFVVNQQGASLVVGAIHLGFFKLLQERISFGRLGHAAIVDQTGRVLAHPLAQWEETAYDMSELEPVRRAKLGETGVDTFFSPAMNAEMIAGFTVVPNSGWGVLVPQPLSELEEAANQFNKDALIILSVGLMLSLALALAVASMLSSKISLIGAQVQQIGQGMDMPKIAKHSAFLGIKELLHLRDGVNLMAHATSKSREDISKRNDELEQANLALQLEIQERQAAEADRIGSEARFRGLFDSAPIPIREEDLSGIKDAVDALGFPDEAALVQYLDQTPDFIKQCADKIVIVDANRASIELHGYQEKTKMMSAVTRELSPASMEIVRRSIVAIYKGQTRLSYEIPIYPSNGEVRQVAGAWMVIAGHEETYRRILLTSVDLTERVKSEERLLKAQKMEAVGQLTGGIAHDFNNLLTVIGGNADLIQEDLAHADNYVDPIRKAVARGSELTQRLLAFSRQQPLAPKNVDLTELIGEMTELLRRTLGENVAIDLSFDPDLWPALADPNQVANALLNLGLNARDAMPNGGKLSIECKNTRVSGREHDELRDGDYVALEVRDTGTGMSADEVSRAFEPFFTTKAVGKGSGLGLSMVYGFAKQSNGHTEIESVSGQGTTVRVLLPRGEAVLEDSKPILDVPIRPKGQGQRILVLEDQDEVRAYLIQRLDLMGYHAVPASNARQAQEILDASDDIGVALCDILLPGGTSGTDFAKQALEQNRLLKVIFISGRPPVGEIGQTGPLENCVVLTKPFDASWLAEILYEHFAQSHGTNPS